MPHSAAKIRHSKRQNENCFVVYYSAINNAFGENYPLDTEVDELPSEGILFDDSTPTGETDIEERTSDLFIRIKNDVFLLECQSYDDDSMAIRIAEYAFISARQMAEWGIGYAIIPMPHFAVIYLKKTSRTPNKTTITFTAPDGQSMDYRADNIFLDDFTREYIIENKLFAYIPFYIIRYEKELSREGDISEVLADLEYFRDEMIRLHGNNELSDEELTDLTGFIKNIITHITDGNKIEERMVGIMGGVILETESERLRRESYEQGVEQGEKNGYELGEKSGEVQAQRKTIISMLNKGQEPIIISELCDYPISFVMEVRNSMEKG